MTDEISPLQMRAMMENLDRAKGVERLPDLSAMPSVEEFPSSEQAVELLREMQREMERLIARERQPWWRKVLRRTFGRDRDVRT